MEVDDAYLLSVLDQLSRDLSVPFLERRGREHCHKRSAMGNFHSEELRDAVETLNERERELLAAIGIAKMLLEKGQKTLTSLAQMREEQDCLEQAICGYKQEIALCRDQLSSEGDKNEVLSRMLSEAEGNVEQLRTVKLHYEQFLRNREGVQSQNIQESQWEEAKEEFELRQKSLESRNLAFERDVKELHSKIRNLESSLNQQNQENSQLRQDLANALLKSSALERDLLCSQTELKAVQEDCKLKDLESRVVRHHLKQLKEELEFRPAEHCKGRTIHQSFLRADTWEDDQSEGSPVPLSPCKPHIERLDSLEVIPETTRKDPSHEYFTLVTATQTTQAVKLNSPYMDTICTVPTRELYEKALRQGIPFHKWYVWVESQMTNCYLESLYSGELRGRGARRRVAPGS